MSFRYFCAIRRLSLQGNQAKILGGISAQQLVKDITEIVIRHQTESLLILKEIEDELQTKNIFINEDEISEEQFF
jgi:polyphosphate kinase